MNERRPKVKVAVCISTYNDFELVNSLLTTIRYYTKYPMENVGIVVCDDGSKEQYKLGLRHIIKQHQDWHKNLHLIEHMENQGIVATWNHLWRFFDSEITILLNNDLLVTKNWLRSLVYFVENNPHCGACSLPSYYIRPVLVPALVGHQEEFMVEIVDPVTRKKLTCQPHSFQEPTDSLPGRVMAPAGMCFATRTSLLREIGGFDESNYRSFYEEIDYGTECAMRGYVSYALPYPYIYHIWSYTFAHNPELKAQETMLNSRKNYMKKWYGDITPDDPYNPHYRFMRKIPPARVKFITYADNEQGYVEKEHLETWTEVKQAANEGKWFKLLEAGNIPLEEIENLTKRTFSQEDLI